MKNKKIFVVEDNPDLNVLYKIAFENEDFHVETSLDGEDAIKKAILFQPDLVLLDVSLPKKNGFEVLKETHTQLPKTIFVINTGLYSEDCVRKNANNYDRLKYLEKPLRIDETIKSVLSFLKKDNK